MTTPPAIPTLPGASPEPSTRAAALAATREQYRYDFSYAGLCFTEKLPSSEDFPAAYMARGTELTARLAANRAASTMDAKTAVAKDALERVLHREQAGGSPYERWERMFPLIDPPLGMRSWRENWSFAWQRTAGPAPIWLRRAEQLPPGLTVSDGELSAVLGRAISVRQALDQGRLYAVDYSLFEGIPAGATDGAPKYLWAPVVLFLADSSLRGGLAPVVIQRAGHTGTEATRSTPTSADWALAKLTAQVADENLQGVLVHMGYCHEVLQRFVLAMHRQFSTAHPLHALLAPHTEFTLQVNRYARDSVLNPGGTQDRLLAPVLEHQLTLLREGVRQLDIGSLDPTIDFARRGVDSAEALPVYPFRDDGLPIWHATVAFVATYVRLYYHSDADVAGDPELAAFVREVGASDGGRLPRMFEQFPVNTVDALIALLSRVIFRASTYHAAINNGNYDWAGFAPNAPTAAYAGFPPPSAATEAFLPSMLPSTTISFETISATWQVAQLSLNRLGQYAPGHFIDPRVLPLIDSFQRALTEIEAQTEQRNATRPLPYPYLLPSRITASINA